MTTEEILLQILQELRTLNEGRGLPPPSAISYDAAAERLGCSRAMVFRLIRTGRLVCAPRIGKQMRVTIESVLLLERGEAEPERRRRARRPREWKPIDAKAVLARLYEAD